MDAVVLCFRNLELGTLQFDSGKFVYNSNKEGEAKLKNYAHSAFYGLFNSVNRKSDVLFSVFENFVKEIRQRVDIMEKAGIAPNDRDFTLLKKASKFPQADMKFWLKECK